MTIFNIEIPQELERELNRLESISKQPKSFFIQEILKGCLEDLADLAVVLEREKDRGITYTTAELKQRLNLQ
jgi:predicted DNA-binding protein